jgi:hypothetical protein
VHQASCPGAIQAMPSLVITMPLSATTSSTLLDPALIADTNKIREWSEIREWFDGLRRPSPASLTPTTEAEGQPLELRVFNALVEAKVLTSHVAMHLEPQFRESLFRQLDSLHDTDEWEDGDQPINRSSFATFLKAILTIKPERRPGLGLSHAGNLIAAWTTGRDRLTIEFLPNDQIRWVLSLHYDDPVRIAGQMAVSRLVEGLAPYEPARWFCRESRSDISSG